MKTRVAVALTCLATAPCQSQSAEGARFQLSADTALVDEPIGIVVSGLPPGRQVTIRLGGLAAATGWRARAAFRADDGGRVDLARMAPTHGSYFGVHPMGLFWSAVPDSGAAPLVPGPEHVPNVTLPPPDPWELTAEVDGRVVATDTVWRRAIASDVKVVAVREHGLVGTLYVPPDTGRHAAVIVLYGSLGGIAPTVSYPGGLASRGFVVLALAYFAAEGLPPNLREIPLEYFGTAIQWLAAQSSVDSTRIGLLGQSRGAEVALLIGATYPAVRAVVAYAPSHVAWPGTLTDSTRAPAWTIGGRPVPTIRRRETTAAVARHAGCPTAPTCRAPLTRHEFLALLDDSTEAARAEIQVERIHGGVLLVSGVDDGLWPSTPMADRIVARLHRHGFPYPVEHRAYEGAGHGIGRPFFATPFVARASPHPITGRLVTPGGTPAGTALASEDSWSRVLSFLDTNLRKAR